MWITCIFKLPSPFLHHIYSSVFLSYFFMHGTVGKVIYPDLDRHRACSGALGNIFSTLPPCMNSKLGKQFTLPFTSSNCDYLTRNNLKFGHQIERD